MKVNRYLLDNLTEQAKINSRLRQSFDLRTSQYDTSQQILNAVEPGTLIPIHRHSNTSETMVIVRGKLIERFYDDVGNLTDEFVMEPCGEYSMVQIDVGQWHSLEVLESGTIIFEAKDGLYEPLAEKDVIQ